MPRVGVTSDVSTMPLGSYPSGSADTYYLLAPNGDRLCAPNGDYLTQPQ